ncbi:thioredoxin family protein [Aurantiacibacter sediminis]|uniref:Thioredoxin family protein n=1 Tax=Aurantiacibacter sediminis TaxID=2793064 RepID=A0ABS0N647_9SPHN|nr:thioredoxin family protein [Aurantiacibacter sediminis]MBH5323245.1 thioredoxin family protein [Aurantiacibacter sediminis]
MSKFKTLFLAIAALFAAIPVAASAQASLVEYSASSFRAAQEEGRIIIVDVHAEWCPTCRAQQPILNELRNDPRLADALFVRVDYDSDRAFLRAHRIPRQSTILIFNGREEAARSIAETNRNRLRSFVLGNI